MVGRVSLFITHRFASSLSFAGVNPGAPGGGAGGRGGLFVVLFTWQHFGLTDMTTGQAFSMEAKV
jgi:hypothetical protein